MREQFKEIKFKDASLELIDQCNDIILQYQNQNLRMTLRQLYYQLVTMNVIRNEEKAYKNLGKLVSNGRLAGLIDWDAIEDRVREPVRQSEWSNVQSLVDSALRSYRLPRLQDQPVYTELWVEKAALAGVLEPLAEEFHVVLMVNRGYSSQSAMYESAQRIERAKDRYGSDEAVVFYLGDLDPSGEDMVRDIQDRLNLFDCDVDVRKIALTIEQVRTFNLMPNPTKLSDSRAAAFVEQYGSESYEVDALPPTTLQRIIRESLEAELDLELMEEVKEREERDKDQLRLAAERLDG